MAVPLSCSENSTSGAPAGRRAWTRQLHCFKQPVFSTEGANGNVGLLGLMSGVSGAAELVPPVLRLWWGCGSCAGWFALSAALTACEGVGASQDKCWGYPNLGAASGVHRLEMVHRSF